MDITGVYKLTGSDNFEAFMKAMGANYLLRKLGNLATPTMEIRKSGEDDWKIKLAYPFSTTEIKFKFGEEFEQVTGDGRHCKSVITMAEKNKMLHIQKCKNYTLQVVREFTTDGMNVTLEAPGGIISTRLYKKMKP